MLFYEKKRYIWVEVSYLARWLYEIFIYLTRRSAISLAGHFDKCLVTGWDNPWGSVSLILNFWFSNVLIRFQTSFLDSIEIERSCDRRGSYTIDRSQLLQDLSEITAESDSDQTRHIPPAGTTWLPTSVWCTALL